MCPGVTWPSHQLLQVVQQSETFLIGHRGEGVVWVDFLQAGDQVSQRVVGSKGVHLSDDTERLTPEEETNRSAAHIN